MARKKLRKAKKDKIKAEENGKKQRLVRNDRVELFKAKGYKVIKEDLRDERGKTLGIPDHANDLTLMAKV